MQVTVAHQRREGWLPADTRGLNASGVLHICIRAVRDLVALPTKANANHISHPAKVAAGAFIDEMETLLAPGAVLA